MSRFVTKKSNITSLGLYIDMGFTWFGNNLLTKSCQESFKTQKASEALMIIILKSNFKSFPLYIKCIIYIYIYILVNHNCLKAFLLMTASN